MIELFVILALLLVVAFFYSSVGHGGASGYIAVLSLMGVNALQIKPSALLLNIFVAGISFYYYYRSGYFNLKLFWPFAVLSIPMAYWGSFITLNPTVYKQVLAVCLLIAVLRIVGLFDRNQTIETKPVPLVWGILIGAALGLFSGMIGIGGGIILSPLILIFRWGNLKETAAVSALFIVVNSIAGLLGLVKQGVPYSSNFIGWLIVAIVGGLAGSYWGSKRAENKTLRNVLAAVLMLAAIKLLLV